MCKCCQVKCCEVQCFPDKKTILKCGCCKFTYYSIFVIQVIFSCFLYFFDIGSDIYVLVDLYNNDYAYFNLCLVIVLLPSIAATFQSRMFNYNDVVEDDDDDDDKEDFTICDYILICICRVFYYTWFFVLIFLFIVFQLFYLFSCI